MKHSTLDFRQTFTVFLLRVWRCLGIWAKTRLLFPLWSLVILSWVESALVPTSLFLLQRTLFVLEALLRSDIPDVFSFLDLTLDELNALTSSTHSSIKAKATKV